MSNNGTKEWLVRTKSGEVLGPFSSNELIQSLQEKKFNLQDEVAPSRGSWTSASRLFDKIDDFAPIEGITQTATLNTQTATPPDTEEKTTTFTTTDKIEGELPQIVTKKTFPRWPFLVALALAFSFFFFRGRGPENNSYFSSNSDQKLLVEIEESIRLGKTAEALAVLNQRYQKLKDETFFLLHASLLIVESDSSERAKTLLEKVLASEKVTPFDRSRAHLWLGYILLREEEGDFGESHFLEALQLNPKDAPTRFNLGRCYLKQEKFDQALEYFQLAELEAPNLWVIPMFKGRARLALQNTEEARTAFKAAIQLDPDRWLPYIYYSLFLSGIHENEAALSALRRMLTRDPDYEVSAPLPLEYFQEKPNYNEYRSAFLQVTQAAPKEMREIGKLYLSALLDSSHISEKGGLRFYSERGSLIASVLMLRFALERNASLSEIREHLEKIAAIDLVPFGYYGYTLRGQAKARLGLLEEAKQDLDRALSLEPKAAVARQRLIEVLLKQGHSQGAKDELKVLLGQHPSYIPALLMQKEL